MVDLNLSEEEQVEALKKWWKENGRSVVAGVVLGLGGVFGWQFWGQYQQNQAAQASFQFQQLNQAVSQNASESAVIQAEKLQSEHGDSSYALFATMELAKVRYAEGDLDGAQKEWQWVIDNSSDISLRQIARLRLARALLGADKVESAKALIAKSENDSFRGEFSEIKGDIALASGDSEAARAAYKEALAEGASNSALVEMKLDDLAIVGKES
ncbi:MAG: tetratricopeptide repeat protein [Gammaproteobacteria bacterium]|nr:tetratricopeptide repeat protein [Gammaproteobacteria bacterium]